MFLHIFLNANLQMNTQILYKLLNICILMDMSSSQPYLHVHIANISVINSSTYIIS